MKPQNTLFILSDEHSRRYLGSYGHPFVQTPNLDRLAQRGTRFTNAYCPSPTCVPCRASLATGQWAHQIETYSSAEPYEGQATSWMHRLRDAGHHVASIGKLHYRSSHPRNGFSEEILPMHIANEIGWVKGLMRDKTTSYTREAKEFATEIGAGESTYTQYDRQITQHAVEWLENRAAMDEEKPWALFVSLVCPHYPLFAPQPFFDQFADIEIPLPVSYSRDTWHTDHPFLSHFYDFFDYATHFDDKRAKLAIRSYSALCSFLDHNVGQILQTLNETGLTDSTRIIYTSDHGDLMGEHGQWTKMCMYEGSVGVPLIVAGEGVPQGEVVNTAVNLTDLYPTILDSVGLPLNETEQTLPGTSLFEIIAKPQRNRVTFSEFHDGLPSGFFMIRTSPCSDIGDWKLIYYPNHPPQLFNLADDPNELHDLGQDEAFTAVRHQLEAELRRIVDPEQVDQQAKAKQARILAALGGKEAVLAQAGLDFGYTPVAGIDA